MERRAANGASEFAFADGVASPRKQPTQDRAKHTVAAILEATIRVLEEAGSAGLTTTRVAEVAGVSVGTLYQYFLNREALLNAVLADHLEAAIVAIEIECSACVGMPLTEAAPRVVRAFLAVKAERADASRIMNKAFGIGIGFQDDRPLVLAATQRANLAIAKLASGSPTPPPDVLMRARLMCAALVGIVREAIATDPHLLSDPVWIDQVVRVSTASLS